MCSPVSVVLIFASFCAMTEAVRYCPGLWQGRYACITEEKFSSSNLNAAKTGCEKYGLHLCSKNELADAWEAGYRNTLWGLVDDADKPDAVVYKCNSGHYNSGECFVHNEYSVSKIQNVMGYIVTTPRPYDTEPAYCCP